MVFEYILKKNGIDPAKDVNIDQSIDFGSTGAAFSEGKADFTVVFANLLHPQNIIQLSGYMRKSKPLSLLFSSK